MKNRYIPLLQGVRICHFMGKNEHDEEISLKIFNGDIAIKKAR